MNESTDLPLAPVTEDPYLVDPGGSDTVILALSLTLVSILILIVLFSICLCILIKHGFVTILCGRRRKEERVVQWQKAQTEPLISSKKRPAPGPPPRASTLPAVAMKDNRSAPRLPPEMPTNIFARDFNVLAFDDRVLRKGAYSEGHDKVEECLSRGDVGVWETAARLSETVDSDSATSAIEELIAKFSTENNFTRDQKNDFLSCIVRDKYWDKVIEFQCDNKKKSPHCRYGLVSKVMVDKGMKCTFAFLEARLTSKDVKNDSYPAETNPFEEENPWDDVREDDIKSYFRQRAIYSLRFEDTEPAEDS